MTNWTDLDDVAALLADRWQRHGFSRAGSRGRSFWRRRGEGIIAQVQLQRGSGSTRERLYFFVNLQICADAVFRFYMGKGKVGTRWTETGSVWTHRLGEMACEQGHDAGLGWTLTDKMSNPACQAVIESIDRHFAELAVPVFNRLSTARDCQREWAASEGSGWLMAAVILTDFEDEESVRMGRTAFRRLKSLSSSVEHGNREAFEEVVVFRDRLALVLGDERAVVIDHEGRT